MLSSAAGYKCVNVTNPDLAGYITGDIMPVRDKRQDGSSRIVKYEDLLFIQEAYTERKSWREIPSTKAAAKGRNLSNNEKYAITHLSSSDYGDYYSGTIDLATLSPTTVSSSSGRWWEPVTGQQIINSLTDPFPSQAGAARLRLDADKVRLAFWNVEKLKITAVSVNDTAILTQYKYDVANAYSDGSLSGRTQYTFNNYDGATPIIFNVATSSRSTAWNKATIFTYANSRQIDTYPWAKEAVLLVLVSFSNAGTSGLEIVPVQCTVTDGVVTFPAFLGDSFTQGVCARHGIVFLASPSYQQSGTSRTVRLVKFALLVKHEFPAEIGSLNWNWNPS